MSVIRGNVSVESSFGSRQEDFLMQQRRNHGGIALSLRHFVVLIGRTSYSRPAIAIIIFNL